ncbi:MAG: LysM peptidoglycan-binding domain-containing protein [Gemmatimonadaceae bacterium]|nr:LysM peptidoglycan-binding domain-containing protein [Gemmatimonadaceae bacterium]
MMISVVPRFSLHQHVRRAAGRLLVAATLLAVAAPSAMAQRAGRQPEALRGSRASVEKMYDFARRHRYAFYLTPSTLDDAIASGKLVPLIGDENYELARGVAFSYATLEVREFVTQFARQYVAACGVPLTVTSAARPMSRQPRNANPHSVHPTGIAVDFRRPYPGPCLTWVRSALAQLEARGFVEATEEHHPVHLHLAVLQSPNTRVRLPDLTNGIVVARQVSPTPTVIASVTPAKTNGVTTPAAAPATTPNGSTRERVYLVRQGDTLWDVAQRAGVSVRALAAANKRSTRSVLRPGTMLTLPDIDTR